MTSEQFDGAIAMKINTNEININSKILILTLKLTLMEINYIYKFKRTKLC